MRAEEGASGPRQEPLEESLDTAQPPLLRLLPILLQHSTNDFLIVFQEALRTAPAASKLN